jgi:uncharacterized protein YggT (Ycf19 family)
MLALLFTIMIWLVNIFPWVMMAGWIIALADPGGRWAVTRFLQAVTMPFVRATSGMLPRIGMLDLSPMVAIILSWIVGYLLVVLY